MSHRYASELHPNPNPAALRVCEGCGCTDDDACLDPETGEACYWVEAYDGDLCSVCARIVIAMNAANDLEETLVKLFSDHEADLAIRERRKAAGL